MAHAVITIPTTELARHFADYLARVRYAGETIVVLKNNTPVAELRALPGKECSLGAFLEVWGTLPADSSFADDLDAVNQADRALENPWA